MFIFEKFEFEEKERKASFFYKIYNGKKKFDFEFCEEIIFPKNLKNFENKKLLNNLLFFLHLLLGISYYKLSLEKKIKIKSGTLRKMESRFFENLYKKGLGEFFYKNNIDFRGLINFPFNKFSSFKGQEIIFENEKSLVPFGGGKDSSLVLKLLEKNKKNFETYSLGNYEISKNVLEIFGKENLIVERKMDKKLFELNKDERFLNGHIPISSIYIGIGVFLSAFGGFKNIILSNENSASEGNLKWNGMEINHQYSKSFEFEEKMKNFISEKICNINFFSILRPFNEVKVTKLFTENCKDILKTFSSCNTNFTILKKSKTSKWCKLCPKCAFVFLLLSVYLGIKEATEIFGANLFDDKKLLKTFEEMAGNGKKKPFECIGTFEEVQSCFAFLIEKGEKYFVINEMKKYKFENNLEKLENFFGNNLIEEEFLKILK